MSEKISEKVEILDNKSNTRITLDGNKGDITVQEKLELKSGKALMTEVMKFDASESALYIGSPPSPGIAGDIFVRDSIGNQVLKFDGKKFSSLNRQ